MSEATCLCCHAPNGLHTADCTRAYRAAYNKGLLDAAGACELISDSASTHSGTEIALRCSESIKGLVSRGV